MSNFVGGSAFSMATQISEGHILLNIHHLKRLTVNEINLVKQELEKILREVRGDQPPLDQIELLQKRNRKISRINQAMMILNHDLQKKNQRNRAKRLG